MTGNGIDLAAVYQAVMAQSGQMSALTDKVSVLSGQVSTLADRVDRQDRKLEVLIENQFKLAEGQAKLASKEDLARLRQTVVEYHSAVVGHGVLISELHDRLRRVEQHLGLPSLA